MKVYDWVHKYGWDALALLPNIGANPLLGNGNVYFVNSTATLALDAADGEHGNSWDRPFDTLDYAIGKCTANQGDIIIVEPGHTEDIAAAAGIDVDVSGISIIGVGVGNLRPTITFSASGSTLEVNGDNILIKGLDFVPAVTAVTVGIDILTGSDYVTFDDCKFYETVNNKIFTKTITAEDKTDYLTIKNCRFENLAAGSSASAIFSEADEHSFWTIENCVFIGDWSASILDLDAAALDFPIVVKGCLMVNFDATAGKTILINSATKAILLYNSMASGKGDAEPCSDLSASYGIQNLGAEVAKYGINVPGTATNFGA